MAPPAADPGSGPPIERTETDPYFSTGIVDFQARERRSELLKFGCEFAAVGRRYRRIHDDVLGISAGRIFRAFQPFSTTDTQELTAIVEETRRLENDFLAQGFQDLPSSAKVAIAFRDALIQYSRALTDAAGGLLGICRSLNKEHQRERAAYDAAVQELRRWGDRLTELTGRL